MKKLLLALLFAAVMLCVLLSAQAFAEVGDTFVDDESGLKFVVLTEDDSSGTVELIANSYAGRSYVIPQSVKYSSKDYTVTSIGNKAFRDCWLLNSITIPGSITSIGDAAFNNCSYLTSIEIPQGVSSIGQSTFADCERLESITIPDSVTSIDIYAFRYCISLTKITIPTGVTTISYGTFQDCTSLKNISLPLTVTTIKEHAFNGCTALTNIGIPGVMSIGDNAFEDCTSLTSIPVNNLATSIGKAAFKNCSKLTTFSIPSGDPQFDPSGLTSIAASTFEGCSSLPDIVIPKKVTSIGDNAFKGAPSLRVTLEEDSQLTQIGTGAYRLNTDLFGAPSSTVTTNNENSENDTVDILIAENSYRFNPILPAGSTLKGLCMQATTQPLTEPPTGISSDFTPVSNYYTFTAPSNPVTIYLLASAAGTAPTITTTSLPNGSVGRDYGTAVDLADAGTRPIKFSVYAGDLPSGLTISDGGLISGRPTQSGDYSFTIRAANKAGYDLRAYTINIGDFIAVENITGVPTTATTDVPMTLTGTVEPSNATNNYIRWSLKAAGTTGATVENRVFTATRAGTATVTATIIRGGAGVLDYTQDFEIIVSEPPAPTFTVTYDANGGSGTMTDNTATEGVGFELPECGFTAPPPLAGSTVKRRFAQWAIGSVGGTRVKAGETHTFAADTTVYAIWEFIPTAGDTNADGYINNRDVVTILIWLKKDDFTPTDDELTRGDIVKNDKVDQADAQKLIEIIAGIS